MKTPDTHTKSAPNSWRMKPRLFESLKPLSLALAAVLGVSFLAGTAQAALTWNLGGGGNWDTTTANWTGDASIFVSDGSKDVIFNNAAGGTITISAGMNPASTTVSAASGTYTFTTGAIAGSGGLTKSGAGTLTLSNPNSTYTGKTIVQGGTLLTANAAYLSNAGASGVFGAPAAGPNATIELHNGVTLRSNGSSPRVNQSTDRPLDLAGIGAGTVSIRYNDNDASLTFGGVTATGTGAKLLKIDTGINGNGDREAIIFTGGIADSSDSSPTSLEVTFNTQGSENWVSLGGTNTFSGPITLSQINGTANGVLVVGGVRVAVSGANTVGTGTLGSGNYPGTISLGTRTVLQYDSTTAQTLAGAISGAGSMQVTGSGLLTLSGENTYTGNTTVNSGCSLALDPAGRMNFKPTNTTSNKITGAGTATLSGTFTIDTSAVTAAVATWTLVDITNKTYTPGPGNFNVDGFSGSSGVWTKTVGPSTWTFTEADGKLTLNTLAVFTSFSYPGAVAVIDNSLFTVSLTVPYGTNYATLAPTYTLSSGICDQPSGSVPSPDFGTSSTVSYTVTDGVSHVYAVTVTTGPAPLLFGVSGAPVQTFDTAVPPVAEWSTLSVAGDSGGVVNGDGMNTMMGTIAASSINASLASQTGSGPNTIAYRRTSDQKLGTQPTGNKATLLMATLYNESGGTVASALLTYTLGVSVTPTEQINGHRLYWSKSGSAGSWTMAGDYLRTTPGNTTINCPLAPLDWANGETLYVVWADDNGTGTEGDFTIDNVSFTPLPEAPFGLTAISGDAQVSLNWSTFPSATSYNVKRSENPGGPYDTTVGTPTDVSFTDTTPVNGTTYYYIVSAMTGVTESGDSLEVSATPTGVDAAVSTVVASSPALWADGIDSSTITVTLLNTDSTPIAGKAVSLVQTSGPGSAAITTVTDTTGADGKAIFTVTSMTVGTTEFTATNDTDTILITQTASVNFVDPATPTAINVNIDNTVRAGLVGPIGGLDAVWNTIGSVSATNLKHASGPRTTVGFTSTNLGGPDEWGAPSLIILRQGLRNFDTGLANSQQIVINNLSPEKSYDLYIASANLSGQRHNGVWSTTNTTTTPGDHPCGNTTNANGSTWVEGNNYVLLRAVVPDVSGKITVNGRSIFVAGFDCRLPMSGFQLVESSSSPDPDYTTWTSVYPGYDLTDPVADTDGDSMTNRDEYAFGLDPTSGASVSPITVQLNPEAGTFTYTRRDPSLTNLAYSVWTSTDLGTWTKDDNAIEGDVTTAGDNVQTVPVTLSPAALATAVDGTLFVRVQADDVVTPPTE